MIGRTQPFTTPSPVKAPFGGIPGEIPPAIDVASNTNEMLNVIPRMTNSRQAIIGMQFKSRVAIIATPKQSQDFRDTTNHGFTTPSQYTPIGNHGGESFLRK